MRIPEGDYIFSIVGVEFKRRMIHVTFETLGRSLTKQFAASGPSARTLRELLVACGNKIKREQFDLDLDTLIGLECAGSVVDEEYRGRCRSVICAFFPAEELREQTDMKFSQMVQVLEVPKYVM